MITILHKIREHHGQFKRGQEEFTEDATITVGTSTEAPDASLIVELPEVFIQAGRKVRVHMWLTGEQRETLIRALAQPVPAQRQSDE